MMYNDMVHLPPLSAGKPRPPRTSSLRPCLSPTMISRFLMLGSRTSRPQMKYPSRESWDV